MSERAGESEREAGDEKGIWYEQWSKLEGDGEGGWEGGREQVSESEREGGKRGVAFSLLSQWLTLLSLQPPPLSAAGSSTTYTHAIQHMDPQETEPREGWREGG